MQQIQMVGVSWAQVKIQLRNKSTSYHCVSRETVYLGANMASP